MRVGVFGALLLSQVETKRLLYNFLMAQTKFLLSEIQFVCPVLDPIDQH